MLSRKRRRVEEVGDESTQYHMPLAGSSPSPLKKRESYPGDSSENEYESEFEDTDEITFTEGRRLIKDKIEKDLRESDKEKDPSEQETRDFLEQFSNYMKRKYRGKPIPETVSKYCSALERNILPAFQEAYKPFNPQWILDCKTPKYFKLEGEFRDTDDREPAYFHSRIMEIANSKFDNMETGTQRSTFISTATHLMEFIELHFSNKMLLYGVKPYERVLLMHNTTKAVIKGLGLWRTGNDERAKSVAENKLLKSYEEPNRDHDVHEKICDYKLSDQRIKNLECLKKYATSDAKPSLAEFSKLGRIVMGEEIMVRTIALFLQICNSTSENQG